MGKNTLSALIEALQILLKYGDPTYPTQCEHDVLYVFADPNLVSDEDKKRLEEYGFIESEDNGGFLTFRFGSA